MPIEHWAVKDYKSIEQGELDLDQFTVLIGKNNSGKSNIIESLRDFAENHNDVRANRSGINKMWVRDRNTGKKEDQGFEITITIELPEKIRDDVFELMDSSRGPRRRSLPELDEMYDCGWLSKLKYSVTYNPNSSIDVTHKLNYNGEFRDADELNRSPEVYGASIQGEIPQNELIGEWFFVDPFREPKDKLDTSFTTDLNPYGSNLIQVLDSLDSNHPHIFKNISDTYVEIMEGVSDLRVEYLPDEGPRKKTIVVEEPQFDTKFRSNDISSGSKEILVLLTQVFLAEEFADVLIIEEPELHVHPGAEINIFDILKDVMDNGGPQIIVSTHSDVFVNQSEVSNIIRVERDGNTNIRSIGEDQITEELTELGYNKSGLLQSEAVVFVEGRSDKRILQRFADTAGLDLDTYGITIVELEGINNMKRDAKSLVKLLSSFNIPYLFLADRHERSREEVQGELFEAMRRKDGDQWWDVSMGNIYVWKGYGIESYLLVPRAIAEGLSLEKDEIEEMISKREEKHNKEEVLNDIYARENEDLDEPYDVYTKDQHGMHIARRMEPGEIPDEVKNVLVKIGGLVEGWTPGTLEIDIPSSE